ncbi:MAG: 3-oxoacyl-ACP reductase [Myxococcota bacterium]|nr:3-oxoacyl-ACP reductase [Myxococcota bacterium]
MSDYLLDLGQNPTARKVVKSLGLPIPIPQALRRARGPWQQRPLHDRDVLVAATPGADLAEVLASALASAGANPCVIGDADAAAPYIGAGEAYGRPPRIVAAGEAAADLRPSAIVFDATGLKTPAALRALYDVFQPWVRSLRKTGRIVVIGRPPEGEKSAATAATMAALEGFVRSAAKEVGRKGATAQLVTVARGAEDRLSPVLRFLLSDRSAFVTGQIWRVTATLKSAPEPTYTKPLQGKVALVTGAARGIGAATAGLLAAEGARVVVLDRPADDGPASRVAREIDGTPLLVDITDADAPERIASTLIEELGGVDIVVHNAGITRDKMLANMKPERWDMTIDVNLAAVIRVTDALMKGALRPGGRVICLSSIAGLAGNAGQTNYSASKAGVAGYVAALAPTLAKKGVTVNAIAPGFIETRLTDAIPPLIREAGRRMSSLSQGGLPQDIGEVVTFLASPGSAGITGEVLRVCGGHLVGR